MEHFGAEGLLPHGQINFFTRSCHAFPPVDPTYHAVGRSASAFTLQPNSPAIHAGADVCGGIAGCSMGMRDYFGNTLAKPRSGIDIGAYQSH